LPLTLTLSQRAREKHLHGIQNVGDGVLDVPWFVKFIVGVGSKPTLVLYYVQ